MDLTEFRNYITETARQNLTFLPPGFITGARQNLEVTAVILSYGRIDITLKNIQILLENTSIPLKILLIDTGASPAEIAALETFCAGHDAVKLILLKENLGIAGTRQFSLDYIETEYVLFVDNDMEVLPGSLENLLYTSKQNPDTVAVAGRIIFPDGNVQMCGANYFTTNGIFFFGFNEEGKSYTEVPAIWTERCNWVNGGFTLFRKRYLLEFPYDQNLTYFEDLEWCYRLNQNGIGNFFTTGQALGIHHHLSKLPDKNLSVAEKHKSVIKNLKLLAYLYQKYGIIVQNVFDYIEEIRPLDNPYTPVTARLILELISLLGEDWFLKKWDAGELDPLILAPGMNSLNREMEKTLASKIGEYQNALDNLQKSFEEKILHVSLLQEQVNHFEGERNKLLAILNKNASQ